MTFNLSLLTFIAATLFLSIKAYKTRRPLFISLAILTGLFPALFLCGMALITIGFGRMNTGKGACAREPATPDLPVEKRIAWFDERFPKARQTMLLWFEQAPVPREELGKVTSIAPAVGMANCFNEFFTDGRLHDFNLDIVAEKGNGRLTTHGYYWIDQKGLAYIGGQPELTIDGKTLVLHETGVLLSDWNRPENLITVLPTSFKRAQAYAVLGDWPKALGDQRAAIAEFESQSEKTTNYGAGNKKWIGWNDYSKAERRKHYEMLAVIEAASGAYLQAAATLTRAGTFGTQEYDFRKYDPDLNADHLLIAAWRRAGGDPNWKNDLKAHIDVATSHGQTCYADFAGQMLNKGVVDIFKRKWASCADKSGTKYSVNLNVETRVLNAIMRNASRDQIHQEFAEERKQELSGRGPFFDWIRVHAGK